jgi:hypothetical protein
MAMNRNLTLAGSLSNEGTVRSDQAAIFSTRFAKPPNLPVMPPANENPDARHKVPDTAAPHHANAIVEIMRTRWVSACQLPIETAGTAWARARTYVGKRRHFRLD